MKDHPGPVSAKKVPTVWHLWSIRWAGPAFAIVFTAKGTLHPRPLSHDDLFRVNPFVILVTVLSEHLFQFLAAFFLFHDGLFHGEPPGPRSLQRLLLQEQAKFNTYRCEVQATEILKLTLNSSQHNLPPD